MSNNGSASRARTRARHMEGRAAGMESALWGVFITAWFENWNGVS